LIIAGDAESDLLAAELVIALRDEVTEAESGYGEGAQPLHASVEPKFYGAGGAHMAHAGVELVYDTGSSQAGRQKVFARLLGLRRAFAKVYELALSREPHAIICVGFFGFNLRLARGIKRYVRHREGTFYNWDPKIIQINTPERWGSRSSRIQALSKHINCVLSANPSEKEWYTRHAPNLRFEYAGQIRNASEVSGAVRRMAQVIVQLLMESEAHFPLRAHLA